MADDEALRHEEKSRGQRAEILLKDPLIVAALDAIKDRAWARFINAKTPQEAYSAREYLRFGEQFRDDLTYHVTTGKLAEQTLLERARQAVTSPIRRRSA